MPIAQSLTPADLTTRLCATPLNLLIYLYEAQLRLAWLQGTLDTLQQQSDALQTLARAPRTPSMVADLAREAIAAGVSERDQLVSVGIPLQQFRNDLENNYRNQLPAGSSGIPDAAHSRALDATDIATLITHQSGMSVQAAANNFTVGLPRVNLLQPTLPASVLRNNRLLRRYGSATETPNVRNLEPGVDNPTMRLRNYYAAYRASWTAQARLFETGFNVQGNTNLRRWIFRDGSYVEIQAHKPALTRSDDCQFSRVSAVSAVAATGGVLAGVIGAGVGLAKSLSRVDALYPQDAAWQGYTIRYFQNARARQPWATRYFYGWKRAPSVSRTVQIQGNSDPTKFANFADAPDQYTWWKWSENSADTRPFRKAVTDVSVATAAQKLVESLAMGPDLGQAALSGAASATAAQTGTLTHPNPVRYPWQQDRSFLRFG